MTDKGLMTNKNGTGTAHHAENEEGKTQKNPHATTKKAVGETGMKNTARNEVNPEKGANQENRKTFQNDPWQDRS